MQSVTSLGSASSASAGTDAGEGEAIGASSEEEGGAAPPGASRRGLSIGGGLEAAPNAGRASLVATRPSARSRLTAGHNSGDKDSWQRAKAMVSPRRTRAASVRSRRTPSKPGGAPSACRRPRRGSGSRPPTGTRTRPPSARSSTPRARGDDRVPLDGGRHVAQTTTTDRRPAQRRRAAADARRRRRRASAAQRCPIGRTQPSCRRRASRAA